jgi:serine/threonine protein phosphatase PrpC
MTPGCFWRIGESVKVAVGAKSDVGLTRSHNEDSLCVEPQLGLFVVCDGLGAHNAGEVASHLASDVVRKYVGEQRQKGDPVLADGHDRRFSSSTNRLAAAIRLANETVYRAAMSRSDYKGMGTTIVAALLEGPVASIAHVGDSRAYLVREGALEKLTEDHSLVAEQVRQGLLTEEEAEHSPQQNIITRAIGTEATIEVTLNELMLIRGDCFLLCSDGLTKGVRAARILDAIQAAPDPQAAADKLVALANQAGGEDNTTVIVVMTDRQGKRPWQNSEGTKFL